MSNEEKGTGALKMPSEESLESIAWQTWPPAFLKPFAFDHQSVGGRVSAEELYIQSKFSDFAEKPTSLVTAVQHLWQQRGPRAQSRDNKKASSWQVKAVPCTFWAASGNIYPSCFEHSVGLSSSLLPLYSFIFVFFALLLTGD